MKTISVVLCGAFMAFAANAADDSLATWNEALSRFHVLDESADRAWLACTDKASVTEHARAVREAMMRVIGPLPPRCKLDARTTATYRRDGYRIEAVYFASRLNFYLTGLLYLPDGPGPFPAVAVTCGHSDEGKAFMKYQRWAVAYAKAGIAAFVYDPIDQGERKFSPRANCLGHNQIGARAALLGSSFAAMRIYDAMRVFDYLQSRPEIKADSLGISGQSGGGTLSSLVMAIEPRVKAATPSCYLTTLRDVAREIGPQDAEQCLWSQLAFGLNHLGYILTQAPRPVLMITRTKDFFPLAGAKATAAKAFRVYDTLGASPRFRRYESTGPHTISESAIEASVCWMREYLKGEKGAWRDGLLQELPARDASFKFETADCGLPEKEVAVAPKGNVMNIPGARSVYALISDEAAACAAARAALPPPGPERAALVRRVAGIRTFDELAAKITVTNDEVVICRADAPRLVSRFTTAVTNASLVISPHHAPGTKREAPVTKLIADLRNLGRYYGCRYPFYRKQAVIDGAALLEYMMGRNMVALWAEDIALYAKAIKDRAGVATVDVVAEGEVSIAVAHAKAAYPEIFADVKLINPPQPWLKSLPTPEADVTYSQVVHGALRAYDWPDLLK